jgi:uncharacterized protein (DUF2249 family)
MTKDPDRDETFVYVDEHDPKLLSHQFEAEAGDEFRWGYQQREPDEFFRSSTRLLDDVRLV